MSVTWASTPNTSELRALVRHLGCWPYLHIERMDPVTMLRVRGLVVGRLNLESRAVSVDIPPDMVSPLLDRHPQLRATAGGVSVQVTDADSRTAAEALLRWRIELERFGPQLRCASP
jgi:hypothetical protein